MRTLENWEQGRAKPNAQAALLITRRTGLIDLILAQLSVEGREIESFSEHDRQPVFQTASKIGLSHCTQTYS